MAYASYYRWLVLNHLFDLTLLPTPLVDVGVTTASAQFLNARRSGLIGWSR